MSIESITSIISQYTEKTCDQSIYEELRNCMLVNFNGLLCSIDRDNVIYECPNCYLVCETYLHELACCIFRHGYVNGVPLQPHESKDQCDRIIAMKNNNNAVVEGCCMPYQICVMRFGYIVRQCGYI
jgi:hypothetical protein